MVTYTASFTTYSGCLSTAASNPMQTTCFLGAPTSVAPRATLPVRHQRQTSTLSTGSDYVDLALNSGGAAWNLNILRSGGTNADSFTASFVDTKVQEITEQPPVSVPEPGTLALLGLEPS